MLHRSYTLLNFFRNISCHCTGEHCIFQIGLSRRRSNILITPNHGVRCKVHVISNSQSNFGQKKAGKTGDLKWTCIITRRTASDDIKGKGIGDLLQQEKIFIQDGQDRVIELNEEKLGKLKERPLNVEPVVETDDKKKKDPEKVAEFVDKPVIESKETAEEDITSKKTKKRLRVDRSTASLERNFITPVKAMNDFLLKPSDLEILPKTKRRSPYEFEPPITVYWRKDVEAKALEVWGSREALLKELLKKELERKTYQQNIFTVKRRLRDYRREMGSKTETVETEGLFGRSGRVVLTAVVINNPNADHPYGYTNMKYVSSLISGVGIFCVGTGLSIYHGIHGLLFPASVESFYWAYFILGGSLVSEGATLLVAINSIKKGAEEKKETFWEYVLSGQDPSVNVVLMEDLAAVLGLVCAASCMGLTSYIGNSTFDAIGSLLVGGLLGGVASFIIYTNVAALVGRSISQENLDKINAVLESDIMVRAIHDVKGIDMGNNLVRYKAELDFDGRELTRSYLDKHDLLTMLEEVKTMQNIDELEAFLLKHGESIVDMLGGEIDRIELKLKKNHPEIRHCDLEVL
ncbi:zinc transporter 9 isoform X3 [Vespa crabro]|uniref:zinc transporter 9 isoform X3 n=1 Tax=Vespa crabro TaxID=7445 RepID=UPI001EFFBFC1|nr:zinc transporter 9 isoform X3 [Vespa crabro]